MCFIKRETVQFAARVHGNIFKIFSGYQVSAGVHFDVCRLSACLDKQHSPCIDRGAVGHAAAAHMDFTSVMEDGIAHDAAV